MQSEAKGMGVAGDARSDHTRDGHETGDSEGGGEGYEQTLVRRRTSSSLRASRNRRDGRRTPSGVSYDAAFDDELPTPGTGALR